MSRFDKGTEDLEQLVTLATRVVAAYLQNNRVPPEAVPAVPPVVPVGSWSVSPHAVAVTPVPNDLPRASTNYEHAIVVR